MNLIEKLLCVDKKRQQKKQPKRSDQKNWLN